jgi:hypothetical protein
MKSASSSCAQLVTLRQTLHLPSFLQLLLIFVSGRQNRQGTVKSSIEVTDSLDQSNSGRRDPLDFDYCRHQLVFFLGYL